MNITTVCKTFADLSPAELYDILQLRAAVFIVEQNCPYLDLDGKDPRCYHLMVRAEQLIAYARLVPPGVSFEEMSIGRIVTSGAVRGKGIGKALLNAAIPMCYEKFNRGQIRIGAQLYAKGFYEQFGFEQASEIYLEDGIEHIEMIKP